MTKSEDVVRLHIGEVEQILRLAMRLRTKRKVLEAESVHKYEYNEDTDEEIQWLNGYEFKLGETMPVSADEWRESAMVGVPTIDDPTDWEQVLSAFEELTERYVEDMAAYFELLSRSK